MAEHIYRRIANQLRENIFNGECGEDGMLPSENELARRYQTSRVTIRKSMEVLVNEGLVTPWHGKGYFVRTPDYNQFVLSFGDSTNSDSFRYQRMLLTYPDDEVAEALGLQKDQRVVVTRRLMERGDVPVAYDEKFIPYERGTPSIEIEINYVEFPEIFAKRFVPVTIRTELYLDVGFAPDYAARALGCGENEPIMIARRLIVTRDGGHIGYGKQYLGPKYGPVRARSGYYQKVREQDSQGLDRVPADE